MYVYVETIIEIKRPASLTQSDDLYSLKGVGTINPATNEPVVEINLPGKILVGNFNYYNKMKKADGISGLTTLQSEVLQELLRTKFNSIVTLLNDTQLAYQKWLGQNL